jgi:hypothetical protein
VLTQSVDWLRRGQGQERLRYEQAGVSGYSSDPAAIEI